MKCNPVLASIFSIFVPGLGQIYVGQGVRGAAILIAAIVVGNLNAIWLSIYAATLNANATREFWAHMLPRILHDLFAFYGLVFLIWQIIDAYLLAKKLKYERNSSA